MRCHPDVDKFASYSDRGVDTPPRRLGRGNRRGIWESLPRSLWSRPTWPPQGVDPEGQSSPRPQPLLSPPPRTGPNPTSGLRTMPEEQPDMYHNRDLDSVLLLGGGMVKARI